MGSLTMAVARARQEELLQSAARDRCCGRGAMVRRRRRQRVRKLFGH